jgi:adenine-specific DNA-methyltransferase
MKAGGGYVAAWYLDEDYDGDCFIDSQMFFPFKKIPPIEKSLKIDVDETEWSLRLKSDEFEPGKYRRCAVKVVDVYGNETTIVRELP